MRSGLMSDDQFAFTEIMASPLQQDFFSVEGRMAILCFYRLGSLLSSHALPSALHSHFIFS